MTIRPESGALATLQVYDGLTFRERHAVADWLRKQAKLVEGGADGWTRCMPATVAGRLPNEGPPGGPCAAGDAGGCDARPQLRAA